jgi:5,10-methenyltetrahydrofolate synthetase
MHEVDPVTPGDGADSDIRLRADVMRWRKSTRDRLIRERLAMPNDVRRRLSERIVAHLGGAIGDVDGLCISAYWPLRGEPDLLQLIGKIATRNGRTALPVVSARGAPLTFRRWKPGATLERGVWGIPQPTVEAEVVTPDLVIAPLVGFDARCYRLGYGGGYFDRTLAIIAGRPRVLGVGYSHAALATIYPLAHDIPMQLIVTEDGITTPSADEALTGR